MPLTTLRIQVYAVIAENDKTKAAGKLAYLARDLGAVFPDRVAVSSDNDTVARHLHLSFVAKVIQLNLSHFDVVGYPSVHALGHKVDVNDPSIWTGTANSVANVYRIKYQNMNQDRYLVAVAAL